MKKVRQITVAFSVASGEGIAALPEQPGPFLLHAVRFSIVPTSADQNAFVVFRFGGVIDGLVIPAPFLDSAGGLEYDITWSRIGATISSGDAVPPSSIAYYVVPLPIDLVLSSQFEVFARVPDLDPTQDQQSEVSFLIEDVDAKN